MLQKIIELDRAGQFAQAQSLCRDSLKLKPQDADLHHALAVLLSKQNKIDEAIVAAREAAVLGPDRPGHHLTLGLLYLNQAQQNPSQTANAKASLQTAIKLDPNLIPAYCALGQIETAGGDLDSAEMQYKLALRAGEPRADVLAGYGQVMFARGKMEEAIRYFSQALELAPQNSAVHLLIGRAFLQSKNFAFAERAFENSLRLNANQLMARLLLSEALAAQNRLQDAVDAVKPLFDKPEWAARGFAALGDIARLNNQFEVAANHYRKGLQVEPRSPQILQALALCELRLGNPSAAAQAYELIYAMYPNNRKAERLRNEALVQAGRTDDAIAAFTHWLKREPSDTKTRAELAGLLEIRGEFERAEIEADQVLLQNDKDPICTLVKARMEMGRQDYIPARARLSTMGNQQNIVHQRMRFALLGHAFDRTGETSGAIKAWLAAYKMPAGTKTTPGAEPVPLSLPDAIRDARQLGCVLEHSTAPVLLLGLPGSGVERIASLLSDIDGVRLLSDRFGPPQRQDDFSDPHFIRYLGPQDDTEAQVCARRYARGLEHLGVRSEHLVVDWLPMWNACFLPMLIRTFQNPKIIWVSADPRDALINWLAFGCAQGYGIDSIDAAAELIKFEQDHLSRLLGNSGFSVLQINGDDGLHQPQIARDQIADFLDRPRSDLNPKYHSILSIGQGLPVAFSAGEFERYNGVLGDVFSKLG